MAERNPPSEGEENNLFHRLHIEASSLRAADVFQINEHSLQSHESCAEEMLVQTFLQKLLMMNYRARNIKPLETREDEQMQECEYSEGEGDIYEDLSSCNDKKTSESDRIHPMDVQMAVFHCADSFLKQLMVTKLSQCQFALPLLVPDPFTQQIEFPLWTFRQIHKSWRIRNTDNEIISQTQPIYKAETPMVFFFRFGSVSSSKSQLMNSLINERHNTFFHRNCPGSSRTRVLMDGVVEIAWFCPSGRNTDQFTDCVAFCNLHGDARDHEKQLQILTEMASVNVALLPRLDKSDRCTAIENLYKNRKSLICLLSEDESTLVKRRKGKYKIGLKGRTLSDVSEELIRAINDCLSESSSLFRLEDVSKQSDIRVDEEDDEDCRRGREAAQQMMSLLKKKKLTEIKESFLPHQGKLWHQWSQKNRELHRPQGEEIEVKNNKESEMKIKRQQQHESEVSTFIGFFINEMSQHAEHKRFIFFLKWLRILLDEYTLTDLCTLRQMYNNHWLNINTLKKNNGPSVQTKGEHVKLEKISNEIHAATFGVEHIMREIGQIYESCQSVQKNKKDLQVPFSSLPSLAAQMMISGFPLELMDGDAAHVPVVWISAVLDQLVHKLGDQTRVFVLSVLGIQSSGKSTMLNAMFGLQFAVGAGRCTRGAFMQLVKVSEEMKKQMNFDYILVVDSEGLCAPELAGRSTRYHDNQLATFVVGLANLTLINIFGENICEIQEILEIVLQAFMRMKTVRLNPSCVFVHQNISDVTALEKNKEGRRRLLEKLDEMTKLAAEDKVFDAECDQTFSDVIIFNFQKDVKYFAQLWEGSPPMAPPNPKYCENIQELRTTIMSYASKSKSHEMKNLKEHIEKLWEAVLDESFNFSFRNSLEISVYRKLMTEYNKWSWSLRSAMIEIENKLRNEIENEVINEVEEIDLHRGLKKTTEEVEKSKSEFFVKNKHKHILIQWKTSTELKIKDVQNEVVRETKQKLNEIIQQRDLKKTRHNTLYEKSKELALKDKTIDEETLKKEFDLFWQQSVNMIRRDTHVSRGVSDPVIYVEKKREEYYSIFQKYCHGSTSTVIFIENICQKLKEPIEQSVYKKTSRDLTDEMRPNCESLNKYRSHLEKHILKTLAEEEDFNKYMNYIHNPRDHFKSFIRDEVSRYIRDKFSVSVLPKLKEKIEFLQKKILTAAHESTEHVQLNSGDVHLWMKSFTQKLSDELIFSERHLSGVTLDHIYDFKLLEDVMTHKLPAVISDITCRFTTKFLNDLLCQCCWVQCPFCGTICTNTIENHDGDHNVPFHRVFGLNGIHYRNTFNLSTYFCTSAMANNNLSFYPIDSDDKVPFRDYRSAGKDYANWSISPDLSERPYWKWVVCRFQKDLEKYYNKTFECYGKVPDEWRKYSKQDAIESLEQI